MKEQNTSLLHHLTQPSFIRHYVIIIPQYYTQTSYVLLMQINCISIYYSLQVLYIKFAISSKQLGMNKLNNIGHWRWCMTHWQIHLTKVYDSLTDSLDEGVWLTDRFTWWRCMTHWQIHLTMVYDSLTDSLDDGVWPTDRISFFGFALRLNLKNTMFRKPVLLPSSSKEAHNLAGLRNVVLLQNKRLTKFKKELVLCG